MPDSRLWSDGELVAGCLDGQKESWSVFVDRFSRLIYWSLRKTLEDTSYRGRQDLLDDLFQEFFRRLLESDRLARLRDAESIRKYLCVAASHLAMDKMKSLRRWELKDAGTEEAPEAGLVVDPKDVSRTAVQNEADALIAEVFDGLSEEEKRCAEWHWLDGKTHREIAELAELPQDTVSTLLRRTKEKLRKKFLEKGLAE
ncbi:MAG: sigma-70 family RNA polymerase sigma factor [Candidatus Omnitrophica bacterium]|nr:sigma-70 family RNA polymerase sigma factor [Candidatus Omnitrophota bacterium]